MTEQERFVDKGIITIVDQGLTDTLTDKDYWVEDGLEDIVELLNNLHEENEELKKRLSDLQKENYGNMDGVAFYQEENASLCEKISDLEFENEELHKSIDELVAVTGLGIDDIIYKYTEDI